MLGPAFQLAQAVRFSTLLLHLPDEGRHVLHAVNDVGELAIRAEDGRVDRTPPALLEVAPLWAQYTPLFPNYLYMSIDFCYNSRADMRSVPRTSTSAIYVSSWHGACLVGMKKGKNSS